MTIIAQQTLSGEVIYIQRKTRSRRPKSILERYYTIVQSEETPTEQFLIKFEDLPIKSTDISLPKYTDFGVTHEHSKPVKAPLMDFEPEPESVPEPPERPSFDPSQSTVERALSTFIPSGLTPLIMEMADSRRDVFGRQVTKALDTLYNDTNLIEKPDRYKIFQILEDVCNDWENRLFIENGVAYYKEDHIDENCTRYYFRFLQDCKVAINYKYLTKAGFITNRVGVIEEFKYYVRHAFRHEITAVKINGYWLSMSKMQKIWIKIDLRQLYQ